MTKAILNIREIVEKEAARAVDKILSERINQKTAEECMKSKFKITPEGNLTFETVAEINKIDLTKADVYDKEVLTLLTDGGFEKLMSQYKVISRRLDECSKLNQELKQHIAELENKETEKPTKINLNDRIKVKLTPLGADIFYHQYDEVNKAYDKTIIEPHLPKVDNLGYTEFPLWDFIHLYGKDIYAGKRNVIDPIELIVVE